MGLDMRPLGKPKPGFEKRFIEIFEMIQNDTIPKPGFFDLIRRKKMVTKEDLLKEWFENQIQSYQTIKAPQVGKDAEADEWLKTKYNELKEKPSIAEFKKEYLGYYVIELAKEKDGVPPYIAYGQDQNIFRGQFLENCREIIGKKLMEEAWQTKLADATLDYGNRLMEAANKIAIPLKMDFLLHQDFDEEFDENSIKTKLHIVYSLAKWLIFYGKNGHGYEADF
jgi:hypothetical protein